MHIQEPLFQELTAFSGGIQELNRRAAMPPLGWQKIYFKMLMKLQAINCRRRSKIELWGATMEKGEIDIVFSKVDRVINGILRKTKARMQSTCEICGRYGKPVALENGSKVLCSKCLAPRKLKSQIDDFFETVNDDDFAEKGNIFSRDDFDDRFLKLIPQEDWSRVKSHEHCIEVDCITADRLLQLKPRLFALRTYLDHQIGWHN
jgi:hypothetical protein